MLPAGAVLLLLLVAEADGDQRAPVADAFSSPREGSEMEGQSPPSAPQPLLNLQGGNVCEGGAPAAQVRSGHSHGGQTDSHIYRHNHSHSHSHGHGHGEAQHKWEADWDAWDDDPRMRRSNATVRELLTSRPWFPGLVASRPVHLLDFGCGTGLLSRDLLLNCGIATCVGADVEEGMLGVFERKAAAEPRLRSRMRSLLLTSQDGGGLPGGRPFHLVTSVFVFGHVRENDVQTVLKRVAAAVAPGGYVCIAEFERIDQQHAGHAEADRFVSDGGHRHTSFTAQRISEMMNAAGMHVDEQAGVVRFEAVTFEPTPTKCMLVIGQVAA
jgi:2-polyprenyl-3-methyl-5-hydroxy-6-metoxy-1,4-benzoquinol methylase